MRDLVVFQNWTPLWTGRSLGWANEATLDITMSRAAVTYKSKKELREMGLGEIDSYIRTLKARTKVGGHVTKSAQKELEVALKIREIIAARVAAGDV